MAHDECEGEWNDDCRGPCRKAPFFSIQVHHGGTFSIRPRKVYIGGTVQTVHGLHTDYISLLSLEAMAHQLGYVSNVNYYYYMPGYKLDVGLVPITNDKGVLSMLEYMDHKRTCVMYLEEVGGVSTSSFTTVHATGPNHIIHNFDMWSSKPATIIHNFDLGSSNFPIDLGLDDVEVVPTTVFGDGKIDLNLDDSGVGDTNCGLSDAAEDDSTTDDEVYYSDHSYVEEDDDALYETFVHQNEEFVGVREDNEEEVHCGEDGSEIMLSDDDSKYDSNNSYYTSIDEENGHRRKHHFKQFRAETDMEDPQFKVGMLFSSPQEFKAAVKQHAIKQQRLVKLVKNDKMRVRAKCMGVRGVNDPCPWEVYAAKVMTESTYQVRTYRSKHKCGKTYSNSNVTSTVIAKRYMDDLRVNPRMPIAAFKERVRKELKVDVSRTQLYKAKRKAGKLIYGTDIEQYGRLWDYCEELRRSNPGSTVVMDAPLDEATGHPKFNRLYIFLVAVKNGFLGGCRKIVGVDGCHLKGEYCGQLLTAVGVDPNNAMYPMAWCVVENENKDTWTWFITLLKMDLNISESNEHEWTFINDRQKGLLSLLNEQLVRVEDRYCCKHILSNFQKQFKGLSLELKFWDCAKASHVPLFHDEMGNMKIEDQQGYEWLAKIPPRHWTRSHFKDTVKCDMVCNNLCEAFNRAILEARDKPIIEMLEWIRCYLSKRMVVRREWISKFNDELLPKCYSKLEILKDYAANASTVWFGDLQFQVKQGGGGEQYTVDLNLKTCSCRRCDLTGIPCAHAIAAIHERHERPEEYIHPCYSKGSYKKAYQPLINPINGYKMWPKTGFTPVMPPDERRKLGRPKMKRSRAPEEYLNPKDPEKLRKLGQNSVYCRRCGVHGHNKRTCKTPLLEGDGDETGGVRGGGQIRGRGNGNQLRGRMRGGGVIVQPRGRGNGGRMRGAGRSRGRGADLQIRGGGVGIQPRGRSAGVQPRGRGGGVGAGRSRGRGAGVMLRGGGIGRCSQVVVPSNYEQATQETQGSQASNITAVTYQTSCRYGNTNRLHGVQ